MNNEMHAGRDTAWQSVRLAVGAVLLVLGGLGLMLLDGNSSASTAHSAIHSQGR